MINLNIVPDDDAKTIGDAETLRATLVGPKDEVLDTLNALLDAVEDTGGWHSTPVAT